jgi:succinate dehydrogenase hydrophobic anchor subunit
MTTLSQTVQGALRYKGGEHQLSYWGHRISGLGTLLFLALHILDTSIVYFLPHLYQEGIDLYRKTGMMIGEMVLVLAVISHGVNGIRIALSDFFPHWWQERQQRRGFWIVAGVTVLLAAPALFIMGRNVYWHNICHCAPEETLSRDLPLWVNLGITLAFVVALIILARVGTFKSLFSRRPRNFETWMWLFMRWSAILLIPLVWIHVLFVDVLFGVHNIDLDYVALRWATLGWRVYDFALLAFAFAHGMNGLRNVTMDYVHSQAWRKRLSWIILGTWVIWSLIGAAAIVGGVRPA